MKIVVIGGAGLIGSKLVDLLRKRGNEVVAAAPNTGVNTMLGEIALGQPLNATVEVGGPEAIPLE